jgi:hypothetical protein
MPWPMAATPKQKIMKLINLFGKILLGWVVLSCQTGFAQNSPSTTAVLQIIPEQRLF